MEPLPDDATQVEEENPAIEQLLELGKERGFVTIDDILGVFPEAERDLDQLEEVYASLLSAGITYLDDVLDRALPRVTQDD